VVKLFILKSIIFGEKYYVKEKSPIPMDLVLYP